MIVKEEVTKYDWRMIQLSRATNECSRKWSREKTVRDARGSSFNCSFLYGKKHPEIQPTRTSFYPREQAHIHLLSTMKTKHWTDPLSMPILTLEKHEVPMSTSKSLPYRMLA